ncbi:MAG: N-acetylglucosamine kinase [Armatimonadota bacterium]
MRYFVGVDGGGSKCDAVLIDETGLVHGWGRGGATAYTGPVVMKRAAYEAVESAVGGREIEDVVLAATWVGTVAARVLAEAGARIEYVPVFEWDAAFAAAGRSWGLAVHCGTGSWAMGVTEDGRELRRGGMGPFVGDEGSGWDIGMRGIRAALKSSWGLDYRTSLAEAIPPALGIDDMMEVVGAPITFGEITRGQIASLAPVVIEAAQDGDRIAREILHHAAESLAEIAALVSSGLDITGKGYPLIGIAGVIQGSPAYWRILTEHILARDATLVPEVPPFRMVVGAALEAMRVTGLDITDGIRQRILQTQTQFPHSSVATSDSPQEDP